MPTATIADVPVEFLTWSVTVSTVLAEAAPPRAAGAPRPAAAPATRAVFDPESGRTEAVPVHPRAGLAPGARLAGPALVAEAQTTTLLPAGWELEVTPAGHLLLSRR